MSDPVRSSRLHEEPEKDPPDPRTRGAHDRDRILYSEAFRRLAGVTQVAGAHEGRVFHNRLLHSLKVAQLARRIAERIRDEANNDERVAEAIKALGGLDPDVAEAAGLAHDLGHPPFGHVAEEKLDDLVQPSEHDGFEGNAQSFRILTQLTSRQGLGPDRRIPGMNLSRATLRAVLKYPWHRELNPKNNKPARAPDDKVETKKAKKWGAYRSEEVEYKEAMALTVIEGGRDEHHRGRSLEAEIMDWADDVTYAIHDLVDFHRAGLIPLEQLAGPTDEQEDFLDVAADRLQAKQDYVVTRDEVAAAFSEVQGFLPLERFVGTRRQMERLDSLASLLIGKFTAAFVIRDEPGKRLVRIDEPTRLQVDVLKELTWRYVILRPGLATQQTGQERVIQFLFEHFREVVGKKDSEKPLLPAGFRDLFAPDGPSKKSHDARLAADIVSGLTEQEAVMLFRRLTGHSSGSLLDWLPT